MRHFRLVAVSLIIALLALTPFVAAAAPAPKVSAGPALAAEDPPPVDLTSLTGVLSWLIAGGAGTIATMLASELAEHWPWFQGLSPTAKRWCMIAVSGAIALGAWSVLTFVPAEVLAQLAVPFAVAMTGILSYLAGQLYHKTTKDEPRIYMDSAPAERIQPQALRR